MYIYRKQVEDEQINISTALRTYRGMQILNLHYNEGFGKGIIMVGTISLILLSILAIFALICFHQVLGSLELILATFLAFFSLASVLMAFSLASSVNESSQDFLLQMIQRAPSEIEKRRIQAAAPLRIYFGNFFYSQPQTILTCLEIIMDNVITLILGYGR